MSKATEFSIVDRPERARFSKQIDAVRATVTTGKAVAIPINGDPYAKVLNRIGSRCFRVAVELNCHLRRIRSDDGLSILVWLEPKGEGK